jgi:Histidine kinase-, DNA gyrase B-, and HSP90-like ATPase
MAVRGQGSTRAHEPVQGSLFEEDYLLRTLGAVTSRPDIALTELVANAWDAGAARVEIHIPSATEEELVVKDDGSGMTPELFRSRWMTLAYNRLRHQGREAEFPPERRDWRRPAYGRSGVGRHGLLCFSATYSVETRRDGKGGRYTVSTSSGKNPFVLLNEEMFDAPGHGTELRARIQRNLPDPDRIRDVLAGRFLHDPRFTVLVNGESVPLEQHGGLIDNRVLQVSDEVRAEAFFIDSTKAARTNRQQGVAFWVGKRLVGTPSWTVGERVVIDGRTHLAKRHTVVVTSDDLFDHVMPDWSSFQKTPTVQQLFEVTAEYVEAKFRELAKDRVRETKESVIREHRHEIEKLRPLAKLELDEFIDEVMGRSPLANAETVSLAVQAVIHLEQTRSGASLLEKLAKLPESDIEGLDRLLREWTIRDALTVLDEIDRRMAIIEALRKVSGDSEIDELRSLHPLVTRARWLFGPEFDSPEYASNMSLQKAVQKVFGQRVNKEAFVNYRNRPDLVILKDATLSAVATEQIGDTNGLARMRDVLLIELKRGGSKIGRDEVNQATGYVEDLLNCGLLDGPPFIRCFVVGHEADGRVEPVRTVGASPERGRIQVATYGQLVRTAEQRLFRLRDRLKDRYEELSGSDLLDRVLHEPKQMSLTEE